MADIKKLLKSMTLREKLAQMTQLDSVYHKAQGSIEMTGPLHEMNITDEDVAACGSVLGGSGAAYTREIQEKHLKNDRLKIPVLFMADVIHGYRTTFPVPLAISCTWDPALAEKAAVITAKEAAASGVHVTFSPMADLVRDPRWGRVIESTGEDPYLNSLFAAAMVRGYQGDDLRGDHEHIAACVKHFAAYGAAEAGRDYNTTEIGDYALREYYLPSYKAAIDAGASMVMASFNSLNGVPATANQWLLRKILRDEWGFKGAVISDWGAVQELVEHGFAEDGKEAAESAIAAGIDIEMMTSDYLQFGEELVKDGVLDEALIDEAVLRILELKDSLGLFEDPFRGSSTEVEAALHVCPAHREAAREIATKSMVLLKNENQTLPLSKRKKVAVIGPFAEERKILGAWCCAGWTGEAVTLGAALEEKLGSNAVTCCMGTGYEGEEIDFDGVKKAVDGADVVILALGETQDHTGEATSRAFIKLPGKQEELAAAVYAMGKPCVLVLFNGRPSDVREVCEGADAVLEAWFGGIETGHAAADILFGDCLPEGRLTMSFPYTLGQVPVYYNSYRTGRPIDMEFSDKKFLSRYIDIPNAPLFPFGYGLNFSPVSYSDTTVAAVRDNEEWTVSATVKNEGKYPVRETVQLYIRDVCGSVVRPVKELKDFKKIDLAAGESAEVSFTVTTDMLAFTHADGSVYAEAGEFHAFVAPDSSVGAPASFRLKK